MTAGVVGAMLPLTQALPLAVPREGVPLALGVEEVLAIALAVADWQGVGGGEAEAGAPEGVTAALEVLPGACEGVAPPAEEGVGSAEALPPPLSPAPCPRGVPQSAVLCEGAAPVGVGGGEALGEGVGGGVGVEEAVAAALSEGEGEGEAEAGAGCGGAGGGGRLGA